MPNASTAVVICLLLAPAFLATAVKHCFDDFEAEWEALSPRPQLTKDQALWISTAVKSAESAVKPRPLNFLVSK